MPLFASESAPVEANPANQAAQAPTLPPMPPIPAQPVRRKAPAPPQFAPGEEQDTAATDGGSISGVGPGAGVAVINPANRERLVRQLFGALNGVDFHDFGRMDARAPCAGSSARD